jgi:hypothetical protein
MHRGDALGEFGVDAPARALLTAKVLVVGGSGDLE